MARVQPADVNEIFDTDLSDSSLSAWIDVATVIVDDIEGVNPEIKDSRLEQIEKLLSAGYAANQDPRISSTSRETASVSYQRGEEYPNDYIAQAVALDPTGVVSDQFKRTATLDVPDSRGIYD